MTLATMVIYTIDWHNRVYGLKEIPSKGLNVDHTFEENLSMFALGIRLT